MTQVTSSRMIVTELLKRGFHERYRSDLNAVGDSEQTLRRMVLYQQYVDYFLAHEGLGSPLANYWRERQRLLRLFVDLYTAATQEDLSYFRDRLAAVDDKIQAMADFDRWSPSDITELPEALQRLQEYEMPTADAVLIVSH